jgi:hypothetical protein
MAYSPEQSSGHHETHSVPQILVYELSFGQPFSANKSFELAAPLVKKGIIDGMDIVPKRLDTAENYHKQSVMTGVPSESMFNPITADMADLLMQLQESKRLTDAISVLKIVGGVGLMSEPYDAKAYGDSLTLFRQLQQLSRNTGHRIQTVVSHQSTLAYLERTGKIKQWQEALEQYGAVMVRTNGWSDRLGRKEEESYIPEKILEQAYRNNCRVAFVSDVFFQTIPDLQRRGIYLTAVDVVRLFQLGEHDVFYVADAKIDTFAQKLVPGDGNHEAEIAAALQQYFSQGGRNVYIKVDPDPANPVQNVIRTSEWIKKQWSTYSDAAHPQAV